MPNWCIVRAKFCCTKSQGAGHTSSSPADDSADIGAKTNAVTTRHTQNPGRIRRQRRSRNSPIGSRIRDPAMRNPEMREEAVDGEPTDAHIRLGPMPPSGRRARR